jgi:hypothetical protein
MYKESVAQSTVQGRFSKACKKYVVYGIGKSVLYSLKGKCGTVHREIAIQSIEKMPVEKMC